MQASPRIHPLAALAISLAAAFLTAAVGSAASIRAAEFYGQLAQPSWSPPAWVFGPVWTALFLMMAVAAWLVWRAGEGSRLKLALGLYGTQLVLNALWSWLFFGWQLGALALVEVVVFWVVIAATTVAFWRIHRGAGLLMLPYLAWVAFATVLNAALVQLNPAVLGF